MLGDYIGISFARNRAVPVFAIASPASGRRLRQSIYATAPPG
jgi:hypothetical protein